MRIAAGVVMAMVCSAAFATEPVQRTLTFDDRVKAQNAIERVYYSHQLGTTKPFGEAVPRTVLESKVRKYLEQSAALNSYWKTAVTDYALQRELERMAQGTKMPERLLELYAALGNDPFLIKECLARPALVDRLTHNFYAFDPVQHVKERGQADALHQLLVSGALSASTEHPNRTVTELLVSETEAGPTRPEQASQQRLTAAEFQKKRAELPSRPGQISDIEETRDSYIFNVVLAETASSARVASYVVPKTTWDAWWDTARRTMRSDAVMAVASGRVDLPVPRQGRPLSPSTTCADDFWDNGSLDDVPEERALHTAVWTGTLMVIWGGTATPYTFGTGLNAGGRYDPATDSWTAMSTIGAPTARRLHTAVWSGSQMLVWGGTADGQPTGIDTGGRYDLETDRWTPISKVGAPSARSGHTAVWTGSRMVVWGGSSTNNTSPLGTGGRYDPATDSWAPTSLTNAPSARNRHTALWTGNLMVVWGGSPTGLYNSLLNTGGRYNPATDSWMPTSVTNAPSARSEHTAVWAGGVMIVWGGASVVSAAGGFAGVVPVNSGARYDPSTDVWTPTSTANAPALRSGYAAVSTGSGMIVWGGKAWTSEAVLKTGALYNPATDQWTPTSTIGAPAGRQFATAVWTGNLMVAWGGVSSNVQRAINTGGRYDPATDSWTLTSTSNGPPPRAGHRAVWTGSLMVVWGGLVGNWPYHYLNDGARYDPTTDSWTSTSLTDSPSGREGHTALWTGSEMVIWGGFSGEYDYVDTGGRYDPARDVWIPTSVTAAPSGRRGHAAVWTGNLMVVWGGYGPGGTNGYLDTGGRYDLSTDSWTPTSMTGAPSGREGHAAAWTGSVMVVWGGSYYSDYQSVFFDNGGRYDPANDSWTATSATDAPSPRSGTLSVWTGDRMLIWGGTCPSGSSCDIGGRYDPTADSWTPMSTTGAPPGLGLYSVVWTGNRMLLWGSVRFSTFYSYNAGGRYDPSTDSWTPFLTLPSEPAPRVRHTAVWTGEFMIVWGGVSRRWEDYLNSGGRFALGELVDDDCDGDGFNIAAGDCDDHDSSTFPGALQLCDGRNNDCADPAWPAVPADEADRDGDGFHLCQADCDDSNATVFPGAPQLCDGINNDCNDPAWPTPPANEADGDHDNARLCHNDCDDANRLIGPGFWEYCDGLDNDCNGTVDDGSVSVNCDDGNPCTDELCGGTAGCSHLDNTNPCDDTNGCTTGDVCIGGLCYGTPAVGLACDDGNLCTADDTCTDGYCTAGPEIDCDDGNACNGPEYCAPHYGCIVQPINCDDFDLCTDDACDPAVGCMHTNNTAACDDGNVCTTNDVCGNDSCRGTPTAGNDCSDRNACTTNDTCAGGFCHGGPPLDCDDGNPCNGLESCDYYYGCVADTPPVCNDGNICTDDACDPAQGCVFTPNSIACDDSNTCTSDDVCGDGECRGTPHPDDTCDDGNVCTTDDFCGGDGACIGGRPVDCDDGNVCNGSELCYPYYGCYANSGPLNCDDGNVCTTDSCNPATGCFHTNTSGLCNDHDACTSGDACTLGSCTGTTVVCDDNNVCTIDTCNSLWGCFFTDNSSSCNDNNPCTDDSCEPAMGGCVNRNNDANHCSDNDLCTQADACRDGICRGSNAVNCNFGCPDGFTTVGALCQRTYDIDASLLENQDAFCDGAEATRYNSCNHQSYGFYWFDEGQHLAAVNRVDVQIGSGLNCGGTSSQVSLNYFSVGSFDPSTDCACDRPRGTLSFINLDTRLYAMGGYNEFLIDPGSSCEGLSRTQDLGNSFARITVTYEPYGQACQLGVCDPGTGACSFSPSPDGADCTDNNGCTTGDSCVDGACSGAALDCNDNNLCTDDSCDPEFGCVTVRAPAGRSCDDHNACDGTEACDAYGTCVSSNPPQCDDHVACTEDSCDPQLGCVFRPYPVGTSCADGNACNGVELCDGAGQCASGGPINCDDNNPCTDDLCDPATGCVHTNSSKFCDDGDACTTDDRCGGGICQRGAPIKCGDGNACTTDSCDSAVGCVFTNNTNDCDDGNACTAGDTCGDGTCHGGASLACDDHNPCTDDLCDPATGCVHTNSSKFCDDGDACTIGDRCGGGTCQRGAPIKCGDGNACTTDSCDSAVGCVFTDNANDCDDGNACTTGDHCAGGSCGAGSPVVCGALDQCHTAGVCNPATGACSNPPKPDGSVCDDASLCTTGETCQSGTCTPAFSGLGEPNPRTNGYYKRLCQGPHSGDQFRDSDAACVASVAATFAGISTVADLCSVLQPNHPNSDPCGKTESDLMVLALNICRARVCTAQSIDSQCGSNGSVGQSLAESDDILNSELRDSTTCAHAKCLDEEINTGRALEMNTLTLRREGSGVRLDWHPPYLDDGTGHPGKYNVWRRTQGSLAAFTKIGTTTVATFVDTTSGGTFEYEVTAVMNP